MDRQRPRKRLKRQTDSIILHCDYDAFYASCIEAETPSLRSRPLAVQQKQIVVTCNYEARRRGLYKLQLIKDAKKTCPDVVIVNGEDLTRFRNASKELYAFLRSFSWNSRCERLGFDEVWMDVTDLIDYNAGLLNHNDLTNSFFCLSKNDPTAGFPYNASNVAGHTYPEQLSDDQDVLLDSLRLRLHLGSALAQHVRAELESQKGYTCTVGVSTNKLLSKLVGNLHKPNGQTTLLPPYTSDDGSDNVTSFIDSHEVGKIPGIGFKSAQKLRAHVLQRPAAFEAGLVYGGTKETVLVHDIRTHPGIDAEALEQILGGPGAPHGIGAKIWGLMNGCDDTEVGQARDIPRQISIEDSYIRLDTLEEVTRELLNLSKSLIERMQIDLLDDDEDTTADKNFDAAGALNLASKRWLAFPKTLRLSTRPRPRPPQNPDGSRNRSFARISRSALLPAFVFSLEDSIDTLSERLVNEALLPLFRKLHPEKSGWNLSLVNLAVANMADAARDKGGVGRDIGKMFKRQDAVLSPFKLMGTNDEAQTVEEQAISTNAAAAQDADLGSTPVASGIRAPGYERGRGGSEDMPTPSQEAEMSPHDEWESGDEDMLDEDGYECDQCGGIMPAFAVSAHQRWHAQN